MANPSTVEFVHIQDVLENIVVLKDRSLRAVVEVSAINFELRSSEEQAAIMQQFQAFLNSVDFPVQIIIHSRKFDITHYIESIKEASAGLTNELLKVQAEEYARFVSELSDLANIMSKKFYVVIPFQITTPKAEAKGFVAGLKDIFKRTPKTQAQTALSAEEIAASRGQLQQRADLITSGLSGMGLKGKILEAEALSGLYHDIYNPIVPATKEQK